MSVTSEISRLYLAKNDIRRAIQNKGVTVPSSTKLDAYDDLIMEIPVGTPELPAYTEWSSTTFTADKNYKITASTYTVPSGYSLVIPAGKTLYIGDLSEESFPSYEFGSNVTINGNLVLDGADIDDNGIVYGSGSTVYAVCYSYACNSASCNLPRIIVYEGGLEVNATMTITNGVQASCIVISSGATLTAGAVVLTEGSYISTINGTLRTDELTMVGELKGSGAVYVDSSFTCAADCVNMMNLNLTGCETVYTYGALINYGPDAVLTLTNAAVTSENEIVNVGGTITGYSGYDNYIIPSGSLTISSNTTTDVTSYASVVTNITQHVPEEISTDAGMTAVLTSANVGKAYKFTGTTGTYVNGDIYIVEET